MKFAHGLALYQQVADKLRADLGTRYAVGQPLPSEGALAARYKVSRRTIREVLLVLESHAMIHRHRGSATVVTRSGQLPVALYSELNLLDQRTPQFYPLLINMAREVLGTHGLETRIYTGRSREGDVPGAMTCPELIADAQAGRIEAILSCTADRSHESLRKLSLAGMPMVGEINESKKPDYTTCCVQMGVKYLYETGRRNLALIDWDPGGEVCKRFDLELKKYGLAENPQWRRFNLTYAVPSAGWEQFREIWTATRQKPDGLIVLNENYLPEIAMAILDMKISVPGQLTIISRTTRHVEWKLPMPIARMEMDSDLYVQILCDRLLHALGRLKTPPTPPVNLHHLVIPAELENHSTSNQPVRK